MYERVAVSGTPDADARALLEARSPSAVAGRIDVPALIVQGRSDSLFPLAHADAMARAIAANGAPVAVDWAAGGHDGGDQRPPASHSGSPAGSTATSRARRAPTRDPPSA